MFDPRTPNVLSSGPCIAVWFVAVVAIQERGGMSLAGPTRIMLPVAFCEARKGLIRYLPVSERRFVLVANRSAERPCGGGDLLPGALWG
jgi:hypothetical protein